jgi:hypothetical protein
MWPVKRKYRHLKDFLRYPLKPLSLRATKGYQRRVRECPYRLSQAFVEGVESHRQRMSDDQSTSSRGAAKLSGARRSS